MSNTAPSGADPVVSFLLANGAHHKKPHSPTHPKAIMEKVVEHEKKQTLWHHHHAKF